MVEADLAAGRLSCPRCRVGVLGGWGCARLRVLRTPEGERRLRPRRGRCREQACLATHVLLPNVAPPVAGSRECGGARKSSHVTREDLRSDAAGDQQRDARQPPRFVVVRGSAYREAMPDLPAPRGGVDVAAVASTSTYRELVDRLKRRIRESQARAARALNTELVMLYWSIGRDILAQQQAAGWGDDIVGRIAEALRVETGSVRGFSRRNLFYMRRLAAVWPDAEKVQTLSAQIGWSHHQVLLDAWADQPELYLWYAPLGQSR